MVKDADFQPQHLLKARGLSLHLLKVRGPSLNLLKARVFISQFDITVPSFLPTPVWMVVTINIV